MIKLAHILLLEAEQPENPELDPTEAIAQHLEALEDTIAALKFIIADAYSLDLAENMTLDIKALDDRVKILSWKCDRLRQALPTLDKLLYEPSKQTYDEYGPRPPKTLEDMFRWLYDARLLRMTANAENLWLAGETINDIIRDERFSKGYGVGRRIVQFTQDAYEHARNIDNALEGFGEILTPLD